MMRSIFADQPYSEVVSTHGESAMRPLTTTFSTLSPSTSFISLVRLELRLEFLKLLLLVLVLDVQ